MKSAMPFCFFIAVIIILISAPEGSRQLHVSSKDFTPDLNTNTRGLSKMDNSRYDIPLHEVPVLCYHQIRNWEKSDSKNARGYIVSPGKFKKQIQLLVDSGYHFILPHQLLSHLSTNNKLPEKPIVFGNASISAHLCFGVIVFAMVLLRKESLSGLIKDKAVGAP